jgi:hypothetical protein
VESSGALEDSTLVLFKHMPGPLSPVGEDRPGHQESHCNAGEMEYWNIAFDGRRTIVDEYVV